MGLCGFEKKFDFDSGWFPAVSNSRYTIEHNLDQNLLLPYLFFKPAIHSYSIYSLNINDMSSNWNDATHIEIYGKNKLIIHTGNSFLFRTRDSHRNGRFRAGVKLTSGLLMVLLTRL